MPRQPGSSLRREGYFWQAHRPLVCLAFTAPLLVLFQAATARYGTSLLAHRDLERILRYFGATAPYLPPLLVVTVLLVQHLVRKDKWEVSMLVLAAMAGEALLWTLPLVVMNVLTARLLPQVPLAAGVSGAFQDVAVAVGAGIYEEFIFRLVLISLVMLLFVDLLSLPRGTVAACAIIVAACLFSLYHFPAGLPSGEFLWGQFLFRALAGVYLGAVFVFRGFGLAVGTHAFFNLFVVFARMF